ncbi:MAG: hypothetical protein NTX53_06895 [candidate division WOR-3 bacterium]|nr:hypothetical protein [candidate division WOR-3 bacterium]
MLQPIAVLREADVNGWWLRVQNSRYSDTLLVKQARRGGAASDEELRMKEEG